MPLCSTNYNILFPISKISELSGHPGNHCAYTIFYRMFSSSTRPSLPTKAAAILCASRVAFHLARPVIANTAPEQPEQHTNEQIKTKKPRHAIIARIQFAPCGTRVHTHTHSIIWCIPLTGTEPVFVHNVQQIASAAVAINRCCRSTTTTTTIVIIMSTISHKMHASKRARDPHTHTHTLFFFVDSAK